MTKKSKEINWIEILLIIAIVILVVLISIMESNIKGYALVILIAIMIFVVSMIARSESIEKIIIILFTMYIPFFKDLTIGTHLEDFHVVANDYYRFDLIQLFAVYFLVRIILNRKRIKGGIDLILLLAFNLICIISMTKSINLNASIFDYLRYLVVTIIYIYFSRVFNLKKYYDKFIYWAIGGAGFQLLLGLLQKLKGGPLGLSFLGEGYNVFRVGVSGYEKGMSGTMSHPGPYGLYAIFILSWVLFNQNINYTRKILGVSVCTLMVILAAGRTSMVLLIIVYGIYFFNCKKINTKKIIVILSTIIIGIGVLIVFKEQLEPIVNRFTNSDVYEQSDNRKIHVDIANYYLKQSPLLGHGLNNYLDMTMRDNPMTFYSNFYFRNPIHNLYLLQCVEIGIIGALMYGLFLITGLARIIALRNRKNYFVNIAKGCGSAVVVYCIYNLQGYGGLETKILLLCILSLALINNIYISLKLDCLDEGGK